MTDLLTQLGVGGIIAILIIREVLNFLKSSKQKESVNGSKPVSRDEFDKHKESVQYRDNCVQIVKRIDGSFAAAELRAEDRMNGVDRQFNEVKTMIGNIR